MADRSEVESQLRLLLRPELHKDYGPNDLQVEGAREVRGIVAGVPASRALVDAAVAAGAHAFVTGEVSEPQAHRARKTGVAFLACGHHASERYGAPAGVAHVAAHVAAQFALEHRLIDVDNWA